MKIEVSQSLKKLSELFPVPLYAVGGFVRDSLLGHTPGDVDLAAPLAPEEVKRILAGTEFRVKDAAKKLLTLVIKIRDEVYEYTAFRKDSYAGGHRPASVSLCSSIETDALRRDFTANSIYYDIAENRVVDPTGGAEDIKNKILRTPRSPYEVFAEDGLRLMRLARFAASLGFDIDPGVLAAARENRALIDEISKERIRDELDKILVCDGVYGVKDAHLRGLELLDEIGVLERILPDICLGKGMEQRSDYHAYDVFGHILQTVRFSHPDIRLAALTHDIAKPRLKLTTGKYHGHDKEGGIMTRRVLTELRYPTAKVEETARLVENHMFNLECDMPKNDIRAFILHNSDIAEKLALLQYADFYGSGKTTATNRDAADILLSVFNEMKNDNVPFKVADLLVKGADLEDISELPAYRRGAALNALLEACAMENADLDTKNKQLEFIKNLARRQQ